MLLDATQAEEQCREGEIIITMNRHGEVCQLAKYGGTPVDALSLLNCTNIALEKVKTIHKHIATRLEEDAKKRNVGNLIAELRADNPR